MASSIVRDITPNNQRMQTTVDKIEFLLLIVTDLVVKFHMHTKDDVWDVIIYILRQINDIQFSLASI
jgi:hypothetical protein